MRRYLKWGAFAALAAIPLACWYVYHGISETIADAYAVWHTANLVIDHLEQNQGAWPRSWAELETTARKTDREPASWQRLRDRVGIDFNADPAELVRTESAGNGPPFRAIYLRNGRDTHWESHEPNQMILDYLQKKRDQHPNGQR